jgi:hypothetical protein
VAFSLQSLGKPCPGLNRTLSPSAVRVASREQLKVAVLHAGLNLAVVCVGDPARVLIELLSERWKLCS